MGSLGWVWESNIKQCHSPFSYCQPLLVCYLNLSFQWSRKLFLVWRTICPAGQQRSAGHFLALVKHFCQLMTDNYQWSFLFSLSDILCGLNTAGQNVRQGLSSLPDISRSLPDMSGMSGIFRDHWALKLLK